MKTINATIDLLTVAAAIDRDTAETYVNGAVIVLGYDEFDGRTLLSNEEAGDIVLNYATVVDTATPTEPTDD